LVSISILACLQENSLGFFSSSLLTCSCAYKGNQVVLINPIFCLQNYCSIMPANFYYVFKEKNLMVIEHRGIKISK
jgi:hypothetical protein